MSKRKPAQNVYCVWNCGNWASWKDPVCPQCRQREDAKRQSGKKNRSQSLQDQRSPSG